MGMTFSPLKLHYIKTDTWEVMEEFIYHHRDTTIIVPKGFVCDLDSIPRIPGIYGWLKNYAIESAVIHDYLYKTQVGRKYADDIFYSAMKDEGVGPIRRRVIWAGVRIGGRSAYNRYG